MIGICDCDVFVCVMSFFVRALLIFCSFFVHFLFFLWLLSKSLGTKRQSGMMVSGLDVWLQFLMSGYNEAALVSTSDMMEEFLFSNGTLDEQLMVSLGFELGCFLVHRLNHL